MWNHCRILEHCCLVLFIWGLWIVFRLSPFCLPNIVFLLGWDGWMCHRLNNRPVNVVSWIDYSPSSYQLDSIFQTSTTAYLTIYKTCRPPYISTVYFLSLRLLSRTIHFEWHIIICTLTLYFCVLSFRVGNKSGVDYRWIGQYNRYCTSFVLRQETNYLERGHCVRPTPCQSTPRFIRERC